MKYKRSEKVDWVSFSFVAGTTDTPNSSWLHQQWAWLGMYNQVIVQMLDKYDWKTGGGRKPYTFSWQSDGMSLLCNPKMEHSLIQISGQGCDILHNDGLLYDFIHQCHDRISRIDFAVDIEIPDGKNVATNFVKAGYSKKFSSSGTKISESGVTQEIGSRKSELYCRAYQYNKPHPRYNRLRIEFELKGSNAKRTTIGYLKSGLTATINSIAYKYDFRSPYWQPDNHIMADIPIPLGTKSDNDTVLWFYKQVRPAFVRLANDGVIVDPIEFLNDCFISQITLEEG